MLMTKTILKNLFHKYATRLHPFEQRVLPSRYRGRFKFINEKCIMCRACALKCPTGCITINAETGLWERDTMACIYCGVCADICPTGCIIMTNVYKEPLTEPNILQFMCKPRPKKSKAKAAAAEGDIAEVIKEKQAERVETSLPVKEE